MNIPFAIPCKYIEKIKHFQARFIVTAVEKQIYEERTAVSKYIHSILFVLLTIKTRMNRYSTSRNILLTALFSKIPLKIRMPPPSYIFLCSLYLPFNCSTHFCIKIPNATPTFKDAFNPIIEIVTLP